MPPPTEKTNARVVSLLPSATELVAAVGAADRLVGVSHECDHPAEVVGLPVLTRAKCLTSMKSGEIDRSVREVVRDALSVYEIDVALLRELDPDVVVTQDLCDVCAVSFADVERAVQTLTDRDVDIVNLSPTRLADIFDDLMRVGEGLGRADEARRARVELEARVAEVARRAAGAERRPRVLTIEWIDPVMVGGTWMPELIDLAGGEALVTRPGDHAPTLERSQLEELDPEVVLIKPCGFDLERSRAELHELAQVLPWERWTSVGERRVFLADGNQYFNRPGPRIVDSLEILAACAHPELFADFTRRYAGDFVRVVPDVGGGLSTEPVAG